MGDTTIFDTTSSTASNSRTPHKSAVHMSYESLKAGHDAYHCCMAVQEHGAGKVINQAAAHYIAHEKLDEVDAYAKAVTVVRYHLNTVKNGGIFKEVRAKLDKPNSITV